MMVVGVGVLTFAKISDGSVRVRVEVIMDTHSVAASFLQRMGLTAKPSELPPGPQIYVGSTTLPFIVV